VTLNPASAASRLDGEVRPNVSAAPSPMPQPRPRSLRLQYLDWVEERIEEYKESVPRDRLLELADEVVAELEMTGSGQYQLTEVLLLEGVDQKIFRHLQLPSYRRWRKERFPAS
jgi:hypothetical protein